MSSISPASNGGNGDWCDTEDGIFPCGECPGCIPQDMRQSTESAHEGFDLHHSELGPWDGEFYVAACRSCDWRSGRHADPAGPFRKHGPATQHWRDKHGAPPGTQHDETSAR